MKALATITAIAALSLTACGGTEQQPLIDQVRSEKAAKPGPKVSKKQLKAIIAKAERYTARQNKAKQR
jgi:hypothetical protein